jgi:hypothetical protein
LVTLKSIFDPFCHCCVCLVADDCRLKTMGVIWWLSYGVITAYFSSFWQDEHKMLDSVWICRSLSSLFWFFVISLNFRRQLMLSFEPVANSALRLWGVLCGMG